MNKVFNINLGGIPFTIDEGAYHELERYLASLHNHFKTSDGYEDIINDIEARLAELFKEQLGSREIVSTRDVSAAKSIMGTPEDFGAEELEPEAKAQEKEDSKYRMGKRFFRDPEDQVIGGVCSGIAAYLGINDPIWVRLAFVLITLSGGFGVALYLILWAISPEAKTAADRLAIRGKKIDISSIANTIESEFDNISDQISSLSRAKKKSRPSGKVEHPVRSFISGLGKVLAGFIEIIRRLLKPIFFIVGVIFIISLALAWVGLIVGVIFSAPILEYIISGNYILNVFAVINVISLIGVPLISLQLLASKILFRSKIHIRWKTGLFVFWGLNLASLFFITSITARDFSEGFTVNMSQETYPQLDTLELVVQDDRIDKMVSLGDKLYLGNDELTFQNVELRLHKAKGKSFKISIDHHSRGANRENASKTAEAINMSYIWEGQQLSFPSRFNIPKGEHWRAQKVIINVYVPEGKVIKCNKAARYKGVVRRIPPIDNSYDSPHNFYDHYWKMGPEGLISAELATEKKLENRYAFSDFNELLIDGPMQVFIEKSDNYDIRITGPTRQAEQIEFVQTGNTLTITTDDFQDQAPRMYIYMPGLSAITFRNTQDSKIIGFKEDQMLIKHLSESKLDCVIETNHLNIIAQGSKEIDLRGSSTDLAASIDKGAFLNAESFTTSTANLQAKGYARAKLMVKDELFYEVEDLNNIEVLGQPKMIELGDN